MHLIHILALTGIITSSVPAFLLILSMLWSLVRHLQGRTTPKPFDLEYAKNKALNESRALRMLVAFDIVCNVLLLNGREDETISAHSWRAAQAGKRWGKVMCWWLNNFQYDHGRNAAAGDLARGEAVVALEKKALGLE